MILIKEVLIGTPWGGGNKNLLAPPGGVNKNLLAPPPNNFLDDAVLFHCSTAAGSCYPLQIQCMANRRAASGGECRSTSSLPTFLASSRPSLVMAARATLPRPCCRETFLVSTAGDGKSELLQKKQRRARAIWHHGGPPPPPWQQPTCCLCLHRLFFQKKWKTRWEELLMKELGGLNFFQGVYS